jgi:hypothetical protein
MPRSGAVVRSTAYSPPIPHASLMAGRGPKPASAERSRCVVPPGGRLHRIDVVPLAGALKSLPVSERTEAPAATAVRLFQYGSNMDQDWFNQQRKEYEAHAPAGTSLEVRLLGRAKLDGWRFHTNLWSAGRARRKRNEPSLAERESCRVANIMREDGAVVW